MRFEKYIPKAERKVGMREILDMFPKKTGRYYHGSPSNLDKILSPDETGNIRHGEENRRLFKDVIFLTTDIDEAIRYAGHGGGTVHHVDASAVKYKDVAMELLDIKKAKTINDNIFIALPEDIKMVTKWIKEPNRKKNHPESYTDCYVGDQED